MQVNKRFVFGNSGWIYLNFQHNKIHQRNLNQNRKLNPNTYIIIFNNLNINFKKLSVTSH